MPSTISKKICPMLATWKLSSAKALNFDKAKILPSGKGLNMQSDFESEHPQY